MALIDFINNFRIQDAVPIDSRFVVDNAAARFAFPTGVVYEGLWSYQKDNDTLYVLVDISQANNEAGWNAITSNSIESIDYSNGTLTVTLEDGTIESFMIPGLRETNPIVNNNDGTYTFHFVDGGTFITEDFQAKDIESGVGVQNGDDTIITFTRKDTTTFDVTASGTRGLQGPQGNFRFTVYQNAVTATPPTKPNATNYTLAEDLSTTNGIPSGWSLNPDSPASGQSTFAITALVDPRNDDPDNDGVVLLVWSSVFVAGSTGPSGPAGISITGATVPDSGDDEGKLVLSRNQGQPDIITRVIAGDTLGNFQVNSGQLSFDITEGDGTVVPQGPFTISGISSGDAITVYSTVVTYEQNHLVANVDSSGDLSIYQWGDATPASNVALTDVRWRKLFDRFETVVTNPTVDQHITQPSGTVLDVTGSFDLNANSGDKSLDFSGTSGDIHLEHNSEIYTLVDKDQKKIYYDTTNTETSFPTTGRAGKEIVIKDDLTLLADEITAILIQRNSAGQTLEQWEDAGNSAGSFVADSANSLTEVSLANNLNLLANDSYSKMIVATENGNDYHFDLLRFQAVNGRLVLQTDNLVTRLANIDTAITNAASTADNVVDSNSSFTITSGPTGTNTGSVNASGNVTLSIETPEAGSEINAQATYTQVGVTLAEVSGENRLTFGDAGAVATFVENIGWPLGNQNFEFASGASFNFEIVEGDGTVYSYSAGRIGATTNFIYDTDNDDHISFQTAALNVTQSRTGSIRTNLTEAPVTDIVGGTNVTLGVSDGTLTINSEGGSGTGDATKKEAATSTWQASLADQYVIGDEVTVVRNGNGLINDRRVYIRTNANPGAVTTDPGAQTYAVQGDSDPFPNIYVSANGNWGLLRRTGIQWRVGQDYIEGDKITQIIDDLPQDYFVIKRHTSTANSKPSDPGTVYVKNGNPDTGNNLNDIFQRPIESIELLTNVPDTVYEETDTSLQVTVGSVGDAAGNTTTFILGTNGVIQQGGLASDLQVGHLVGFTTTPNDFTTVADNGGNGFEVTIVETVTLGDGNDYTRVTVSGDLNLIAGSNNFLYRLAYQTTLVQAHQLNFNRGIEDTPLGGNNPNGLVEIGLTNTGVTAGEYTNTNIRVDEQGRITSASNGTSGTAFNPTEYDPTQVYNTGDLVTADGELFQCTATTTAQPGNSTIETEGDNWRSITETLASVDSVATFPLLTPSNSIIRVGEIMCVINDPSPYNNGLYRVIAHNASGTSVARIDELDHLHEIVEGIIQHSGSSATFEFPDDNPAFITGTLVDETKFTTVEGTKSTTIPSLDTVGPKFEPGNGRMTLIYSNLSDEQITQLEAAVGSDLAFRTTAGGIVTAGNVENADATVAAQRTYHFLLKSVNYRLGTGRRQLNFVMRDLSEATNFVSAFSFEQNTGLTGNAGNLYIPTDGPLVTNLIDNISLVTIVAISGGGGTDLSTSEQATLTGLDGISNNAFPQRSGTGYAGGTVITGVALGSHIGEITVTTNTNGVSSSSNIGVDHIVFSDDTTDWDGTGIPDDSFGMDGQLALSNFASAAYIKRSGTWSAYIFPSSQVATTFGALRTVIDLALTGNSSQTVIEPNTTNQSMAIRGNGTGAVILDGVSTINDITFDAVTYTAMLVGVGSAEITTTAAGYETNGLSYTHNSVTYYRLFLTDGTGEILTTNINNTDAGDIVYSKQY